MSKDFEFDIDISSFIQGADRKSEDLRDAIITASQDILNTWQAEARSDAPIDTDTLRKNIEQRLETSSGLDVDMALTSNAYNDGFNYAYYQHNVRGIEYLETSFYKNESSFNALLESRIRAALGG